MGKILSLALLELFYLLCSEILIACQLREILKNLIVLGILNSVPLIFFQGHKAIFHRITFKSLISTRTLRHSFKELNFL